VYYAFKIVQTLHNRCLELNNPHSLPPVCSHKKFLSSSPRQIFFTIDSWNAESNSYVISDEPFIPDMVDDMSDDDDNEKLLSDEPSLPNFHNIIQSSITKYSV